MAAMVLKLTVIVKLMESRVYIHVGMVMVTKVMIQNTMLGIMRIADKTA